MRIAVCDDDIVLVKETKNRILEYTKQHRFSAIVEEFTSGYDLLNSTEVFDCIFLDYQMDGLNGIDVATKLRERKISASIIFVTSYPEIAIHTIPTFPHRFLIKPVSNESFKEAMDSFISKQNVLCPIAVKVENEIIRINSEDILYLQAENKSCYIVTKDGFVRSSKTLSAVLDELPSYCFFRTHKSFAVNLYYVTKISKNSITLKNGKEISLSRSNHSRMVSSFSSFLEDNYIRM